MDAPAYQPPPSLWDLAAAGPVALFLDFDGTLVNIAQEPGAILVASDLAGNLAALSQRLEGRLALISGRAIADLEQHCGPLAIACGGSHGAELRTVTGEVFGSEAPLPIEILREVAGWAFARNVLVETKPFGLALHTRTKPELEEDCARYLEGIAGRNGLALKRGKRVAELVRPGADKGLAVRRFMTQAPFAGAMPIFVGDDLTDEDGFAACVELGGFGIAVGERVSETARFGLFDPSAVRKWASL
jgi:trehalose 6-phosphate phosphatase